MTEPSGVRVSDEYRERAAGEIRQHFAAGLARNAWRLYGPAPELDKVEAELTRRNQRAIERTQRHGERTQRRSERRGGGRGGDQEQ